MNFIVVGTNHKYSPIEIRERISFSKKRLRDALNFLTEGNLLTGAVIVSTCNRVEIYASCEDLDYGLSQIEDFISVYHEIDKHRLAPYLYRYTNKEAIAHIFRVACGLDSQVLGEIQILGQVKFFYEQAKSFGFTDRLIDAVFNKAIAIGKIARIKTKISYGNISIASIAINLIKQQLATLTEKKILLIGVGEISELLLKYLKKENTKTVFISNRTYEKAFKLAASVGAQVVEFEELKEKLNEADVIISATSSPHIIIKKKDVVDLKKPLLIIDLAVPRDVDPEVKYIKGTSLFCLDDLGFISEKNLEKRTREIPQVEKIIKEEVKNLWSKLIYAWEREEVLLP